MADESIFIDLGYLHRSYSVPDKLKEVKYINQILDMAENGHTITSIAAKFTISVPTVYKIIADNRYDKKCNEEK